MEYGIVYPQIELGGDPAAVRSIGIAAEELGYDYLLAYDHLAGAVHEGRDPKLWGPYTENDPFHDVLVMFAYLAGVTTTLNFATGVVIMPQRQTLLLARQAADVDLLSGERLRLGVGVGWNYVEYDALGQDFTTRGKRADEQIDLLRKLWTGDVLDWQGTFDRVDRARLIPAPTRQIPIWVGGFSDPAFRRAARVGDGFIFAGRVTAPDEGMARIRHFADEAGRDLTDFGAELVITTSGTIDESVEAAQRFEEAGGTHVSFVSMKRGYDSANAHIDFFAEVKDRL